MKAFTCTLLLCCLTLVSCTNNDNGLTYQTVDFEAHIQHDFNNTHFIIELDGKAVFDDYVTTNPVLGLAEIVPLRAFPGNHHIRVILKAPDGTRQPDYMQEVFVDLSQPVYICVATAAEQRFTVNVKKERPMYD